MTGRMMSALTVATMMTIFFVPALDAAWFRVERRWTKAKTTFPVTRRWLPDGDHQETTSNPQR